MKRFLLIPILIVAASCLVLSQTPSVDEKTRANLFAGTWKANLSKSKQHANHQFLSATVRFEVSDDAVLLTFTGVDMAGKQESGTRKLHPDGKEYPVKEAPGIVEVTKWVDSRTLETVAKKDGKVIGEGTYQVSGNGKTLTAKIKGIDASGASFEQVIVFDRESPAGKPLGTSVVAMESGNSSADPTDGTWDLDVAASKFDPGPARTVDTRVYTSDGKTIHLTGTVTFADGKQFNAEFTGAYDGKDYPVKGNPRAETLAQVRIDYYTVKTTTKRGGKVIATSTRVISKDGKVMTITSTGIDEKDVPYNNTIVLRKR